jgi:hypothetical protein
MAPRVHGNRAATRRQVLRQLEHLLAEAQPHHAHAQAEDALQPLVVGSPHLHVRELLEAEHAGIEVDRAVHVGHRHADGAHGADEALGAGAGRQTQESRDQQRAQPGRDHSRALRWSATRSALAMMVSAGFTAPLDGKKLPSTT